MSDLNALIDVIDGFRAAPSFEERLRFAQFSLGRLGAVGVNIGEVDVHTQGMNWLASSYPPGWMDLYTERRYYQVDEVLLQGAVSSHRISYDVGLLSPADLCPEPRRDMDRNLHEFGFRSVLAQTFPGARPDARMGLSLVADTTLLGLGGGGHHRDFSRLAAVTCEFIGSPDAAVSTPIYRFGPPQLTPAEQDVLAYLAAGKLYGAISDRLCITEVAVRKRMTSAKRKLGAATREQAVALAVRDRLIDI